MELFSSSFDFDCPSPLGLAPNARAGTSKAPTLGRAMDASDHADYSRRQLKLLQPSEIQSALESDAVARRVLSKSAKPCPGDLVGVRLNLNVFKTTGVCVHTIHRGGTSGSHLHGRGFWNGEVLHYAQAVVLRDAYFNVQQKGRECIASGRMSKHPMASIDGELCALETPDSIDGVEVRFNPRLEHLFVDQSFRALWYAELVVIVAHRAYARGRLVFHTATSAPARAGDCPTRACY